MRIAPLALLIVLLPACGQEDPRPFRPPGGGTGSSTDGPDASLIDADIDAAVNRLDGIVCVIDEVDDPFECPDIAAADNVDIAALASGTTAVSDASGLFTIDLTVAIDVLQLGGGLSDGLVTTVSSTNISAEPVTSPVLEEGLRDSIYANLTEVQTSGAMLIYIRDASGPVAGATVTAPGGRIYYDDGAGGFVDIVGTGNDGIALIVDTTSGTVTATEGLRSADAAVATVVGGFGVAVIALPAP